MEPYAIPSPEDIAWTAGFYEGEGHAGYIKSKYHTPDYLVLLFTQVNPEPLLKLQALWGGSIDRKIHTGARAHLWQPCYRLRLSGIKALTCARAMMPLLSEKRRAQMGHLVVDRPPRHANAGSWTKHSNAHTQGTYVHPKYARAG